MTLAWQKHLNLPAKQSQALRVEYYFGETQAILDSGRDGASAPVRALDQEGESPSMSCLNLLADSNCVTARWGGEQLEANDQSVG